MAVPVRSQTFVEMLRDVRAGLELTQIDFAAALKISPQYYHDLEVGRRLPSVNVVNAICDYLGRGPVGRLTWHIAGAEAHGWRVARTIPSDVIETLRQPLPEFVCDNPCSTRLANQQRRQAADVLLALANPSGEGR